MLATIRQRRIAKSTQILWRLLGNALVFSFALLLANRSAQAQYSPVKLFAPVEAKAVAASPSSWADWLHRPMRRPAKIRSQQAKQ